jgi:outer membrane protein TolC
MNYLRVLFICLISIPSVAQEKPERAALALSLKQAVELAITPEGNTRIQLTREALKQAQSRSTQALGVLLPDISSSMTYRDQTINLKANGLQFNIPSNSGLGFSFPSLVGPFNVMDARVSATQSIFDFSSIRRLQAARAGAAAAKSDLANAEEQVAAQVARAYLLAIRTDADLATAQSNVALSKAVLAQAQNQKAAGTSTGIEITRARVQLANDNQRLLVVQNARRSAHLQLLRVMRQPLDAELELTDKLGYIPVDAVTIEQASSQALASRPDLKAQLDRENSTRLSASATKMERVPTLSFFGDYGTLGSGFDNSLPTRTAGITLRVPIFDGGRKDARRAESASQYRAEKMRTQDLKEQIELDVRLALDLLRSAEEQVKVSQEGQELAENELAQAQRRYEAGVSFSLEVTDAQNRLERARDNRIQALYNYNVARIDLDQAMGKVKNNIR